MVEIGTVVTAGAAIIAASLGYINHNKIKQVHVLVNSRLDAALEQIGDLKDQRRETQDRQDIRDRDNET